MMALRCRLCAFLVLSLAVTRGSLASPDPVFQTNDGEGGTCHYELKISTSSCHQCKLDQVFDWDVSCTVDGAKGTDIGLHISMSEEWYGYDCDWSSVNFDGANDVIGEVRERLASIEEQIQRILAATAPPIDQGKSRTASLQENDGLALHVLANEGARPEGEAILPKFSGTVNENEEGKQGLLHLAGEGVLFVNPPGTHGQSEVAAPGHEDENPVEGLESTMNFAQVTELPSVISMATTNEDLEHSSSDETAVDTAGTETGKKHKKRHFNTQSVLAGRAASSDVHSTSKPEPSPSVTDPPLIGGDDVGLDSRPRWRLYNKPAVADPPRDNPKTVEPLGRAGVLCMDGCSCLRSWGYWQSGEYDISNPPASGRKGECVRAYCDMVTDGGAWTVIQNRVDGSRNFYRKWSKYASGFGRLESEFWLGNDLLHGLTARVDYQLRVEFSDWDGEDGYALYDRFIVGSSAELYRLTLGRYLEGSHGDSLSYHNDSYFSTYDRDNDASPGANCAELRQAGFWFKSCNQANPNGRYIHEAISSTGLNGGIITWGTWPGHGYSYALKTFRMMIRPVHYDQILYY